MRSRERPAGTMPPLVLAQKAMRSGEHLVWAERPTGGAIRGEGIRGVISGLVFSVLAVVWGGFAFILTVGSGPPFSLFPYVGILFFLFGLMVVAGSIRTYRLRRSTLYALSRERLLVINETPDYRARSFDVASITGVESREAWGGSGTLVLTLQGGRQEKLLGVPAVRRIADQIERLRRKAARDA